MDVKRRVKIKSMACLSSDHNAQKYQGVDVLPNQSLGIPQFIQSINSKETTNQSYQLFDELLSKARELHKSPPPPFSTFLLPTRPVSGGLLYCLGCRYI